ncbi:MAG: hypothetical protein AABZ09_10450, partial [Candidatus Binatota bacterium]
MTSQLSQVSCQASEGRAQERAGAAAGLPARLALHRLLLPPDLTVPSMALPLTRPVYWAPPA